MMFLNHVLMFLIVGQMNSAAIIHQSRTTVQIDSGWTDRYFLIEILNDLGKIRYGDMKQRYDSRTHHIETLIARTWLDDSTFVEPDTSAISDVSAPEVSRAPEYSRLMMRVVTFPALRPHATIEYHYRIVETQHKSLLDKLISIFKAKPHEPFFSSAKFQSIDPIDTVSYTIKGNDLSNLRFYLTDSVEIVRHGDTMITWQNTNVPAIIREDGMVPINDIAPRLIVSEFPEWDSVASFFAEKFRKPLSQWKSVKNIASETAGSADSDTALMRIFDYGLTKIRTVPIDFGSVGYRPTAPDKVNSHGYGDPKDKAVLLATMLEAVGIKAVPLAVRSADSKFLPQIPSPGQFDHVIVEAFLGDSVVYLDPTARYTRYGSLPSSLTGKYGVEIENGGKVLRLPDRSIKNNRIDAQWMIELAGDGTLQGELTYKPAGSFEEELRRSFFGKTSDLLLMDFRSYANDVAEGTKLLDYQLSDVEDIHTPAEAKMHIRSKEFGIVEGDMMIIELPEIPFQPRVLHISLNSHQYPILTGGPFELSYTWKIQLPHGFKVDYAPKFSASNRVGSVNVNYTIDGNTLKVTKSLIIEMERVNPLEYPLYRYLGQQFVSENNNLILLEKVGE